MRRTHIVWSLMVVVLMGAVSTRGMAQGFAWWAYDSVLEEIQGRGSLRVGLGLFEPWSACNADGDLIGFEIDVATKLAEDIGVKVEFARTNWNYIIPALVAEEFDAIISGLAILPWRNLKVNYTSPYNAIGLFLIANIKKSSDLKTLADFNNYGVTIATRRGASSVGFVESVFPEATLLLFDTNTEVIQAVVAGDAHAAASFSPNQRTWVEANPETLYLPFEEAFASETQAMAIRKGDLDTLNFFNGWIVANEANGWLEQRRRYWFEGREWEDQVATDPDIIAACDESFQ